MVIKCKKLTGIELMQSACACTIGKTFSGVSLDEMYRCEHSPIRTQVFWIEMEIPSFVSVHFVRHKIGVEHFVKSLRDDRGGDGTEDRNTPVYHGMLVNAQALINMSRKRLCSKAHIEAQKAMVEIKDAIAQADHYLPKYMVAECEYRRGCFEMKPCGRPIK